MIFTGRIVQIPYRTSSSSHNAVDIREVLRRVAARVSIRPLVVTALWIGLVQMSYADSTVVSGDNQTATVNSPLPQPLVGSVTCDGTCTVTWSSSAGDTFSPASEVISVVEGPVTVSTIVTLSGTPGTRTITLQDSQQGVRATFTATAVASPTPTPTPTPIPSSAPTPTPTPIPTISPLSGLSGLTPNQKSVAAALDSACPNASGALEQRCRQLYSAALSDAEKVAAIGQITPEQIAAQTTQFLRVGTNRMVNIEHRLTALRHGAKGSQITFNADGKSIPFGKLAQSLHNTKGGNAGDNPDDPFRDSPLGVYVQGRYNGGDLDNTLEERGYRFNTFGFTMGADYRFSEKLILGMAWGYDSTAIDYSASTGKMDTQTVHGVFYGSYYLPEDIYLDWIANYSGHDYDMTRNVRYTGFDSNIRSNPSGSQYGVSVNLGKDFALAEWTLNPYARTEYIKLHIDSYSEHGGDGLGMAFDGQSATSLTTDLGTQIGRNVSLPWGVITPALRFEWEHQFEFDAQLISGRLLGAAPGTGAFAISTAGPQRDYFNLGGSIAATFAEGRSAFLRYETRLGQAPVSSHIVELGVRVPF